MAPKYFIIKYSFNKLPQYSLVKYITCINTYCLVEEYFTKEREWVADYDIYPLKDHNVCGSWAYDKDKQSLIPANYFNLIND